MKSNHLLTSLVLLGTVLTTNAQDVSSTPYLVSGGDGAGAQGVEGTYYGHMAGKNTYDEARRNCFFGNGAGTQNTLGGENVFMGYYAGINSLTGEQNVFIGSFAAMHNKDGNRNVMIGNLAGSKNGSGTENVYLGFQAGHGPTDAMQNTYIGTKAGKDAKGDRNVFIGFETGAVSAVSDQLYISNSTDSTPLIWGDFKSDLAKVNGKLGTGNLVDFPSMAGSVSVGHYSIFAMGGILTEELRIMRNQDWADYVFTPDYKLAPLDEVEAFIKQNGHLPNVPSAAEIKRDGMEVGEIATIQQEKIEELTLYLIEQKKQNEKQDLQIEKQNQEIKELKALVQQLTEKK